MYLSSQKMPSASSVDPNSKRLFYDRQRLILSGQRRRAKHPYGSCGNPWLTAPQTVFPIKLAITSCHIHGSNSQDNLWSFCNTISKSSAHTSNEVSNPPRTHSRCLREPLLFFQSQSPQPNIKWRFGINVNAFHTIHHREGPDVF